MRVLLCGTGQLGGFAHSLDAPGDQHGSPMALSEGHQHLESPEMVGGHKVSQQRAWMLPWELPQQGSQGPVLSQSRRPRKGGVTSGKVSPRCLETPKHLGSALT